MTTRETLKTLKTFIHNVTAEKQPTWWGDKNTAPFAAEDAPIMLKIAITPRKSVLVPFDIGMYSKGKNGELVIYIDIQDAVAAAKDSSRKQP